LKVFDLLVLLVLVVTAYSGFKNGFIKTIFKTTGYLLGGVAGVAIAVEVMNTWSSNLALVVGSVTLVLLLAKLGKFVFEKAGLGFRKVLLIPPFKFIDALLGAAISFTFTVFILYLLLSVLLSLPDDVSNKYLYYFNLYTYSDTYLSKVFNYLNLQINQSFDINFNL
jgi:uncharacterized membrane protein required for colicin V production